VYLTSQLLVTAVYMAGVASPCTRCILLLC